MKSNKLSLFCIILSTLDPPSAPQLLLQIPPNSQTDHWALVWLTGGFHPSRVTLIWTYHSAEADIDHRPDASCTLPANNSRGSLPEPPADGALLSQYRFVKSAAAHQSQCLLMTDIHSQDVYLFSWIVLPKKQLMEAGITLTCWVKDHPAMNNSLTSSFTWGKYWKEKKINASLSVVVSHYFSCQVHF